MTVYSHKHLPGFPFSEQIVHTLYVYCVYIICCKSSSCNAGPSSKKLA